MESPVIHFHGTPVWGNKGEVLKAAVRNGGAFVSFARPDQIRQCLELCNEMGIDNGAFSHWKRGLVIDWARDFYPWLMQYYFHPKVTFFIIPDVIEGGEEENDRLIANVPAMFRDKAVPVWHLHESIERLVRLCKEWPRVAFGSSGEYAVIRTKAWHQRMTEAFDAICGIDVKIHGLRMLDGRVLGNYPLDTADSTNLACNVPKWKKKYPDIGHHIAQRQPFTAGDKAELLVYRAAVLRGAVESVTPPPRENRDVCCHTKGAYITHSIRTDKTEHKITIAIEALKRQNKRASKAAVARKIGISREHINRRYQYLFAA